MFKWQRIQHNSWVLQLYNGAVSLWNSRGGNLSGQKQNLIISQASSNYVCDSRKNTTAQHFMLLRSAVPHGTAPYAHTFPCLMRTLFRCSICERPSSPHPTPLPKHAQFDNTCTDTKTHCWQSMLKGHSHLNRLGLGWARRGQGNDSVPSRIFWLRK